MGESKKKKEMVVKGTGGDGGVARVKTFGPRHPQTAPSEKEKPARYRDAMRGSKKFSFKTPTSSRLVDRIFFLGSTEYIVSVLFFFCPSRNYFVPFANVTKGSNKGTLLAPKNFRSPVDDDTKGGGGRVARENLEALPFPNDDSQGGGGVVARVCKK
jgi:hypothetical protein